MNTRSDGVTPRMEDIISRIDKLIQDLREIANIEQFEDTIIIT